MFTAVLLFEKNQIVRRKDKFKFQDEDVRWIMKSLSKTE